ncbi:hypothetical protein YOLOSWAG_149 [Erwinia phage vB_EamM_Yoloswag]|uniref:Uncharacterized protein n=1 Tax=Erwinia phage vB_EamM_Yoloswag TaxID=1958956 RepID=A0A1S6L399_9CAUD|nr:tail sheath [Erwinia phage vB_EamM_Yoloswag]AQT28629.1 hypothetical protein YOLOSWAG_149 [Erwinia phage vB_EamM_Yoloswag]
MFIERTGFIDNQKMWKQILADLTANGFTAVSVNGTLGNTVPTGAITSFVVKPTNTIDPLIDAQPWRLALKINPLSTRMYAGAPEQISDLGEVAKVSSIIISGNGKANYAGAIGSRYFGTAVNQDGDKLDPNEVCFYHRGIDSDSGSANTSYAGTMSFSTINNGTTVAQTVADSLIRGDQAATPFTYTLSLSNHGFALHIRVEGQDDAGCRQHWVVIQRAINSDGTVVTEGKAPLFCMFSVNGGGSPDNNKMYPITTTLVNANPDTNYAIMRFTVREADVNAPTAPINAAAHSSDAFAVINPFQQVPFSEDNKFDFRLPQGFNTQRYSYPYEMDMVGFASADVISNGVVIETQVYGEVDEADEPKLRKYKAVSANSPKNTGMRLFLLAEGGGV